jgi:hypothetical protein
MVYLKTILLISINAIIGFSKKHHHHHNSASPIEVAQTDGKPYPFIPRKYNGCYDLITTVSEYKTPDEKICFKCDLDA